MIHWRNRENESSSGLPSLWDIHQSLFSYFQIQDNRSSSFFFSFFFFCDLRIHNISGEASYINSASLSDKQGRGIFIREHSCEASRSLIPLHLKDDVEATVRRAIRGRAGGALSVFTKGSTYCVWRWTYRCISNWPTEDTRGVCM